MTQRITLKPGDYVSTDGMDEATYHAVARAFMASGAESGEYPEPDYIADDMGETWAFGSLCGALWHGLAACFKGRHLTPQQVVNATNTSGQTQDTLTTIIEKAAEHDAKAKHHSAEHDRMMAEARAMLPDGWRLVKAEDMSGGPSLTIVDGQDMTDPANWRAGDVVEAVRNGLDVTKGRKYTITGFDSTACPMFVDDAGDNESRYSGIFRFHRRP